MSKKAQELAARYGRKSDIVEIYKDMLEESYHVNAFTNPNYPVITPDDEIQVYKWGLIPFWTKDEQGAKEIRKMTCNAKAETIFKLPSFREPIMKKRCIVPSTGYFEWHHNEDKSTTPYYIYLKEEVIFSMAGIYDVWQDKQSGELIHTFSIITTEANSLTGFIHNNKKRMPVILDKKDEEKWIDPKLSKSDIENLLKPFPAISMDAHVVDKDILKRNPHDPAIIEKVS